MSQTQSYKSSTISITNYIDLKWNLTEKDHTSWWSPTESREASLERSSRGSRAEATTLWPSSLCSQLRHCSRITTRILLRSHSSPSWSPTCFRAPSSPWSGKALKLSRLAELCWVPPTRWLLSPEPSVVTSASLLDATSSTALTLWSPPTGKLPSGSSPRSWSPGPPTATTGSTSDLVSHVICQSSLVCLALFVYNFNCRWTHRLASSAVCFPRIFWCSRAITISAWSVLPKDFVQISDEKHIQ